MYRNGNVLFLILLAVALFAALSYAVTQAGRSGGKDISDEVLMLKASEITQYLDLIRFRVQRATINGHPDYALDFYNTTWGRHLEADPLTPGGIPTTAQNNSCSDERCRMFQSAGGPIPEKVFGYEILPGGMDHDYWPIGNSWLYPGHVFFSTIHIENVGSSAPELVAYIPYVSRDFCETFNTHVGFTQNFPYGAPVDSPTGVGGAYSGTLSSMPTSAAFLGDDSSDISGKHAFCSKDNAGGTRYIIYYVLIPR